MTVKISQTADVQRFFEEASGQLNERGDPRTKALVRRILDDTAKLIEEMQVTPDEFWKAVDYLNRLGSRQEAGLLAAGLGLEHYLDLLLDAQDAEAGLTGGTPRTIEGPLYVAGAPLSDGEARMDDGRDAGTVMFLQGRVSGPTASRWPGPSSMSGTPIPKAPIPTSTAASPNTTCAGASAPTPTAATVRAASCRPATVARATARPRNCSTASAATASGRRTFTSSSRRPAIAT